jgi:hypothetical protein
MRIAVPQKSPFKMFFKSLKGLLCLKLRIAEKQKSRHFRVRNVGYNVNQLLWEREHLTFATPKSGFYVKLF